MAETVDFTNMLSLTRASLDKRSQLNYLGSKELTLTYNIQTAGAKELAAEWLAANRTTLVDPEFAHRTYEGTWKCVDIVYSESPAVIKQRFKIDSALTNDVAQRDAGGDTLRSYYWKIVDPTAYNVPTSSDDGDTWTKSVTDNGDGTYDVTISQRTDVAGALTSDSWVKTALYSEETEITLNDVAIVEPTAAIGTTVRVQNTPLDNGLYRTETTTRTAIAQRTPPTGELEWINDSDESNLCYLVTARNQPYATFIIDANAAQTNAVTNTYSVDINEFGLYDYTLRGRT
jgi:hypothetical protein